MVRQVLIVSALLVPVFVSTGCAPKNVRQADVVAKQGDWETALTQYRLAAVDRPNDKSIVERIRKAEQEVALVYMKRAADANAAGHLGEAGDMWKKALELTTDAKVQEQIKAAIAENSSALEYYGDISAEFYSWPDAIGAYGALLTVTPENVELLERFRASKREYAGELTLAADDLAKRDLKGSALVANLRALQQDPMQPGAFDRVSNLRKEIANSTRVDLGSVRIDDHGYKGLAVALAPKLSARIDDYPPYGPTKENGAVPAEFKVVIESFSKGDSVVKGVDVLPNEMVQPTEPVPNPAIPEQEKKLAGLDRELKKLQADLKKTLPGKGPKPTPSTKKKIAADNEAKRLKGLELARAVDAKRKEIAAEKLALAALPATVPPPRLPATWELPWAETVRVVEAKVRFEVREKDFEQPMTITLTHKVEHKDRQHDGNEKQGMLPDRLELPTYEAMCAQIAEKFAAEGPEVIARARARRVERMIAEGRSKQKMGDEEAALNAYVETMFMVGSDQLPEDAAVLVAKEAENEKLKEILGTK